MVHVWNVESMGSMSRVCLHKGLISHITFSVDGMQIMLGRLDKTVHMWCTESGQALIEPLWLEQDVTDIAFDNDDEAEKRGGNMILAADKDSVVFAWDMVMRELLMVTPANHPALYM